MRDCDRPVAVFDSGLGGISVLRELVRQLPKEHFLYYGDSRNAPYGSRPTEEIRRLTLEAAQLLFAEGIKALVVACNTATSAAIGPLREKYPEKIIIGIEPALKPAVDRYPHGKILVLATDATLREQKFAELAQRCGTDCEIIKCPCPKLVEFVERGETQDSAAEQYLRRQLSAFLTPPPDAVVLGCTHYPFLKTAIRNVVGAQSELIDGADGTARETKRRLQEAGLLRDTSDGSVEMRNSLQTKEILRRSMQLLSGEI